MADTGQEARGSDHARGRGFARYWPLTALLIMLAGVCLSGVVALSWSARVRREHRQAFEVTAGNVAATMTTLVQADANYVTTMRAILTIESHVSPTGFDDWYDWLQGARQQIGGVGIATIARVPFRQLRAFERARNRDPAFTRLVGGMVQPLAPEGHRTECLLAAGHALIPLNPVIAYVAQTDLCDTSAPLGYVESGLLNQATASGQTVIRPAGQLLPTTLFEVAFYRRGVPLQTVAERRATVRGWLVCSIDMPHELLQALGANHGYEVSLTFTQPDGTVIPVATEGAHPDPLSRTVTIFAGGRWTFVISGPDSVHGLTPAQEGWLVFATGVLISALVTVLLLALSHSRARALALVQETTAELRHQAMHDSLTGLPNRLLALNRAEQMLARSRRSGSPVAFLYIDLDDFKHVNDTHGHGVGDRLLQMVAERLRSVVREADTAARLSGDEFIVLVESSTLDAGPELVAERVIGVLREPYDLTEQIGSEMTIGISIGIATGARQTAEELLADADVALYSAKNAGKNTYVLYESGMQAAARERIAIEAELTGALESGDLSVVYQPSYDLRSDRIVGSEALLRWRSESRGAVDPNVFVPIAENSGLIVSIGRWVLLTACRDAAQWHANGHMLSVAVKISWRQLDHKLLVADVRRALQLAKLEPSWLTLEITETSLMRDVDAATRRLAVLKQLGVQIAVDDFGTGLSSLSQLPRLPVDILKIDRSFVQKLNKSTESLTLIRTLIELGRSLRLKTLAEGIEERAALEALRSFGCDYGQGFLLSRPVSSEALVHLLDARPGSPTRGHRTNGISHAEEALRAP